MSSIARRGPLHGVVVVVRKGRLALPDNDRRPGTVTRTVTRTVSEEEEGPAMVRFDQRLVGTASISYSSTPTPHQSHPLSRGMDWTTSGAT
jgi:hypothetical protein